jgi:hypothetical protein
MPSSVMLHRAALVRTDVSMEIITSIGELGTILFLHRVLGLQVTANLVPSSPILLILMREVVHFSETSVLIRATRGNI